MEFLKDDVRWRIGNEANISVWFDTWVVAHPLVNDIGFTEFVKNNMNMKVGNLSGSTLAAAIMIELWFQRNEIFFEGGTSNCNNFKTKICQMVYEGGHMTIGNRWGQAYDFQVISYFNLRTRNIKFGGIKEFLWSSPDPGYTLCYCDGSSFGNPSNAGFGIVVKDNSCQVLGTMAGGIGIATNFNTEVYHVLHKCIL